MIICGWSRSIFKRWNELNRRLGAVIRVRIPPSRRNLFPANTYTRVSLDHIYLHRTRYTRGTAAKPWSTLIIWIVTHHEKNRFKNKRDFGWLNIAAIMADALVKLYERIWTIGPDNALPVTDPRGPNHGINVILKTENVMVFTR